MKYETDGKLHRLAFDKDEMITLISLVYDGFEYSRIKSERGDQIAKAKNEANEGFVGRFKDLILSTDVTKGGP